ncbi:alanine-glyoxylate aminotransferase [Diplodia corticola]|uniref:alanine--glyoxylate transaminase n=1 Tax=Diplodia corticola TaxID=236234 RepID=A0A1J9RLW3_9PEZI|nr:alanine-glyoxylate aminotransferase [Diplodia corticola]OJD33563.1 alanine-glyoxylate aminotransferase [Diplodia corticola]
MGELAGRQYVGAPPRSGAHAPPSAPAQAEEKAELRAKHTAPTLATTPAEERDAATPLVFARERTPGLCGRPPGLAYANPAVNGNRCLSGGGSRRSARPRLTLPRTRPEVGKLGPERLSPTSPEFPRPETGTPATPRRLLSFYPSLPSAANLASRAQPRLSLIERHLDVKPPPLNTPYSSDRAALPDDDIDPQQAAVLDDEPTMSTQEAHPTLLIPGPIEFDDAVLQSMSHYSESHVGAAFVAVFGETLSMLRKLFQTTNPASQPFVISGSGTLGWDQVAANLTEPGDEVLVLHTGYFADSFADCFDTYGAKPTQLKAPIGDRPQQDAVEKALKERKYKLITVTHVDTSTGVLSDIKSLAELVHRVSPETLIVVDGVCSVGSEDIRFDDWGIDVVLTASQKAIGCPAGLSIVMASGRAIEAFQARKTKPASYFGSWKNWLPIMQNYEAKKPSYFATPSPQLVRALHTSLTQILASPLDQRFARHKEVSQKIKQAVADLGLKQLADKPENQANGMTAIYLPEGMAAAQILPNLLQKKVIFAGGLHKEIATKYIRFGHMGVSVTDPRKNDIDRALDALKSGLAEAGYQAP